MKKIYLIEHNVRRGTAYNHLHSRLAWHNNIQYLFEKYIHINFDILTFCRYQNFHCFVSIISVTQNIFIKGNSAQYNLISVSFLRTEKTNINCILWWIVVFVLQVYTCRTMYYFSDCQSLIALPGAVSGWLRRRSSKFLKKCKQRTLTNYLNN